MVFGMRNPANVLELVKSYISEKNLPLSMYYTTTISKCILKPFLILADMCAFLLHHRSLSSQQMETIAEKT